LPLPYGAFAFDVGWSGLEPHHMLLLELQFGGVLDGDNALGIVFGKNAMENFDFSSWIWVNEPDDKLLFSVFFAQLKKT
jgi:hypothetical protein